MLKWISGVCATVPGENVQRIGACATPSPLPMHPPLDGARLQEPGKEMLEWISGVGATAPGAPVNRLCACALKSFTSLKCKVTFRREEESLTTL